MSQLTTVEWGESYRADLLSQLPRPPDHPEMLHGGFLNDPVHYGQTYLWDPNSQEWLLYAQPMETFPQQVEFAVLREVAGAAKEHYESMKGKGLHTSLESLRRMGEALDQLDEHDKMRGPR